MIPKMDNLKPKDNSFDSKPNIPKDAHEITINELPQISLSFQKLSFNDMLIENVHIGVKQFDLRQCLVAMDTCFDRLKKNLAVKKNQKVPPISGVY